MHRAQTVAKVLTGMFIVIICSGPVFNCECSDTGIGGTAELEVDKTIMLYEDVAQGFPQTRNITVYSVGKVGLVFNTLAIDGGAQSPFKVLGALDVNGDLGELPQTLFPGSILELVVEYDPQSGNAEDFDILRIATNDKGECHSSANPCEIQLAGQAAPPDPNLEVVCQQEDECALASTPVCRVVTTPDGRHPTKLLFNFCEVIAGNRLELKALLRNAGNVPLTLDGLDFDPSYGDPSDFRILEPQDMNFELAPQEAQMLTMVYVPAARGADSAGLNLTTNDNDIMSDLAVGQFGVRLLGLSAEADIDVYPENIPFVGVTQGSSDSQTINIHNVGDGTLVVSGLEVTGGSVHGEFSVDSMDGFDVPGGGMASVQVTYSPQDVGQDNGAITIYSNDPDEAQVVVTLGGEVRPDLDVVPQTVVEFANVDPGGSAQHDVILTNVGFADMTISAMSLSLNPGDPPVFETSGLPADFPNTPLVLAPAESYTFVVTFTDNTTIADEIGQLDIAHDSPSDVEPFPLLLMNSGTPANLPPVAVVTPPTQVVHGTQQIFLDAGSSFDPDVGDSVVGWSWSFLFKPQDAQGNNSQAVLDSTDQQTTTFTPDMVGQYKVRLIVYDTFGVPSIPVDAEISVNQ